MWVDLTEDVLAETLNGAELQAVAARRGTEQVDPVPGILAGVAAKIRGRIRSGGRTRLQGSDLAIPDALWTEAVDIVRYQLLLRLALNISEPRKIAYQTALKTLDDISSGAYVLTDDDQPKAPGPMWFGRPRRWGPNTRRGII